MITHRHKEVLQLDDPRWRHIYFMSERISNVLALANDSKGLLLELRDALTSILEAFPKEVDPAVDPEGYAIRRFAGALLDAIQYMSEELIKNRQGETRNGDKS